MDSATHKPELSETGSAPAPRDFAEIHRDVWRVVRSAPAVFVLLPALLWFPIDVLIEAAVSGHGGDWLEQTRLYIRLGRIAEAVVGTLVTSVFLAALVELGGGRPVTFAGAVKAGFDLWGRVFGVFFSAAWRIALATLLLIVPGLYLTLRYALAMPAAVFEGYSGPAALDASAATMKGRYWRVGFGVSAAALIYVPLAFAPMMAVPGGASPWLTALADLPLDVLGSLFTVGLTLLYADARREPSLAPPVGRREPEWVMRPESELPSGRRGVAAAAAVSAAAFVAAFCFWSWFAVGPIDAGDEAWEREAYEEALGHYRHAAYWDPEDAYVQYSIGWALYQLDRHAEAETHFARTVELEPENAGYRLDHARVLIDLGQTTKAGAELEAARQRGLADSEEVARLEERLLRPEE